MPSSNDIRAGGAFVEAYLKDAQLNKGLKAAQAKVKAFGASVTAIGKKLSLVSSAAVAPLGLAAAAFAKMGDNVAEMSQRTGVSTRALSEMGFAAEQSGSDLATLEKGIRKMQQTVTDAAAGSQAAADALASIGLSASQLAGLNPDEQFKRIADGVSRIEDPSTRAAVAMDVLGRSGAALLPLMEDGAAGIEALQAQAVAAGRSIGPEQAKAASDFNDSMNVLKSSLSGVAMTIGGQLIPAVQPLVEDLAEIVNRASAWAAENSELIMGFAKLATTTLGASLALVGVGKVLGVVSAGIGTAGTAFNALLRVMSLAVGHPVIATIVGLAAGVTALSAALKGSTRDVDGFISRVEKSRDESNKLARSHLQMFERLRELQGKQRLTNEEFSEAQGIIGQLQAAYGRLGVEIDATTGKITGLAQAQDAAGRAMAQANIADLENKIAGINDEISELKAESAQALERVESSFIRGLGESLLGNAQELMDANQAAIEKLQSARKPLELALSGWKTGIAPPDVQPGAAPDAQAGQRAKVYTDAAKAMERVTKLWSEFQEGQKSPMEREIDAVRKWAAEYQAALNTMRSEQEVFAQETRERLGHLPPEVKEAINARLGQLMAAEKQIAGVEKDRIQKIRDEAAADEKRRAQEQAAAVAAANRSLQQQIEDAEIDLQFKDDDAGRQRAHIRKQLERDLAGIADTGLDPEQLQKLAGIQEQLVGGAAAAQSQFAAAGTFSAMAAARMGSGGPAERLERLNEQILAELKKHGGKLDEINRAE